MAIQTPKPGKKPETFHGHWHKHPQTSHTHPHWPDIHHRTTHRPDHQTDPPDPKGKNNRILSCPSLQNSLRYIVFSCSNSIRKNLMKEIDIHKKLASNLSERKSFAALNNDKVLCNNNSFSHNLLEKGVSYLKNIVSELKLCPIYDPMIWKPLTTNNQKENYAAILLG